MTIKAKILLFVLACGAITLVVAGVGIATLSAFNDAMVDPGRRLAGPSTRPTSTGS